MEIKQTFTIDCNTWRCGAEADNNRDDGQLIRLGKGDTCLLNDQGYMCCLGQIAVQLGVQENELLGVGEPDEVESDNIIGLLTDKKFDYHHKRDKKFNTTLSSEAMNINDASATTIESKMNDLKELFKVDGYGLEFINIPADVKQQQ